MERYERLGWLAGRRLSGKLPDEAYPIEPWLREPRRLDLVDRTGQPLPGASLGFVRRARVTAGVVVHTEELPGDNEGPDFDVRVLFNDGERPALYRFRHGYDAYHWAASYPEHYAWFQAVMRVEGMPLTMLYDPDAGTATPLGQIEPFISLNLAELLALAALQPEARRRRLYEGVDLLEAMRKRDAARFREVVGPVLAPSAGPSVERWTRELARRIRLEESPEGPLAALARALPDERAVIWATL
jgi:hypothetical protein